jgi:hypothetical protein
LGWKSPRGRRHAGILRGSGRDSRNGAPGRGFHSHLSGSGIQHIKFFRSRPGNIYYTPTRKRPPVVNPNVHLFIVDKIGNRKNGSKRKIRMSRRKIGGIEQLAGSGRTAFKFGAVPRSRAFLPKARAFRSCLRKNRRITP